VSLLLGIETATVTVSAAIVRDGLVLGSFSTEGTRRQTEILHPGLLELFDGVGCAPSDLDGVVVDVGPGRFTGVRVGIAAAKGIAFATGAATCGVTSTSVLLEGAAHQNRVAVVDLRRGEIAVEFSDDGEAPPVRTSPHELGTTLARIGRTDVVLIGDGAVVHRDAISEGAGVEVTVEEGETSMPSAAAACRIAERRGPSRWGAAFDLDAVYLRGADVRLGWTTRDAEGDPVRMEVDR
jgi:tRNA threonylcarbamoyladenosine biosynthesis protein TsaB